MSNPGVDGPDRGKRLSEIEINLKPKDDPGVSARKASKPESKPAPAKKHKALDPVVAEARAVEALNRVVLESAMKVADKIGASQLFLIIDDPSNCRLPEALVKRKNFVLAVTETAIDDDLKKQFKNLLGLPHLQLSRVGRIKMAVMRSLSAHMLTVGDKIVCVTGSRGLPTLDTVMVLDIGKEYEILSSQELANLSTQVRTEVFEELVTISVELSNQGREGKPVGSIFVLGDTEKVMNLSRQMIFNPFHGYPEEERNILDPRLRDTIKEFSALDGAFIIRDDGVIMASGRHLNAALENEQLPQGLGARHAAAAGITDITTATAVVISESTGTVRIFRKGKIFMEIEKAGPPLRK
jgi:DNA integrity scanning protein DisA with diadenylate cyclase activity